MRIPGTNPRHKIGLEEAPVAADLGAWNDPAADLPPHRIGMDAEKRRRGSQAEHDGSIWFGLGRLHRLLARAANQKLSDRHAFAGTALRAHDYDWPPQLGLAGDRPGKIGS